MVQTTQNPAIKADDPHVTKFERFEKEAKQPSWLFPLRKAGMARFAELGFPTLRDEDWRFTNVAPIAKLPFEPVFESTAGALTPKSLNGFLFAGLKCNHLVFVNGHFSEELSTVLPQPEGVEVGSLASALARDSATVQKNLARSNSRPQNAFAALNTAFFLDGAYIHLPDG